MNAIHVQRGRLIAGTLRVWDQNPLDDVHQLFTELATKLLEAFYKEGVKFDAGRFTAALDKIQEAKNTCYDSLLIGQCKDEK